MKYRFLLNSLKFDKWRAMEQWPWLEFFLLTWIRGRTFINLHPDSWTGAIETNKKMIAGGMAAMETPTHQHGNYLAKALKWLLRLGEYFNFDAVIFKSNKSFFHSIFTLPKAFYENFFVFPSPVWTWFFRAFRRTLFLQVWSLTLTLAYSVNQLNRSKKISLSTKLLN